MILAELGFCFDLDAKLPLYAFKRLNKIVSDKGMPGHECKPPPVAFLDSLLLGEVNFLFFGRRMN